MPLSRGPGNLYAGAILVVLLWACSPSLIFDPVVVYPAKRVRIQLVSLFNQRQNPARSEQGWRGDWVFRRERLQLIDTELNSARPDVVIMHEVMQRSRYDSDQAILSAGALRGFTWSLIKTRSFADSGETEFTGIAIGVPGIGDEEVQSLRVAQHGKVSLFLHQVKHPKFKLYVLNIIGTDNFSLSDLQSIVNIVSQKVAEIDCRSRTLIAGHFSQATSTRFGNLFADSRFREVFKGLCNVENECFNSSPRNGIFLAINGEIEPAKTDYLWTERDFELLSVQLNFINSLRSQTISLSPYHLDELWPTERFGLMIEGRLLGCQ